MTTSFLVYHDCMLWEYINQTSSLYVILCIRYQEFSIFVTHKQVTKGGHMSPLDTIELTATSCNFSLRRRVEKVCVDRQLLRYS